MKLRATLVYEYDTGDEEMTLAAYGTIDPGACAELDKSQFEDYPGSITGDLESLVSVKVEPVQ